MERRRARGTDERRRLKGVARITDAGNWHLREDGGLPNQSRRLTTGCSRHCSAALRNAAEPDRWPPIVLVGQSKHDKHDKDKER